MVLYNNLYAAILVALNHAPVANADIDEVGRTERLTVAAVAVADAAKRATCIEQEQPCKPIFGDVFLAAGMLVSLGENETRMSKSIQEGRCGWHECGGKNYQHDSRARSYFQLEKPPSMSKDEFNGFSGLTQEAVSGAAWYAMKHLAGSYYVCKKGLPGAYSGYARGQNHCEWGPAAGRARDAYYYTSVIRREFMKTSVTSE